MVFIAVPTRPADSELAVLDFGRTSVGLHRIRLGPVDFRLERGGCWALSSVFFCGILKSMANAIRDIKKKIGRPKTTDSGGAPHDVRGHDAHWP
jgi:hypothetical protein